MISRIPSELSKIWLHLAYDIETISPQTFIALAIVHMTTILCLEADVLRMRRGPGQTFSIEDMQMATGT